MLACAAGTAARPERFMCTTSLRLLCPGRSGEVVRAVIRGTTVCACKIYKFDQRGLSAACSPKNFVQVRGQPACC